MEILIYIALALNIIVATVNATRQHWNLFALNVINGVVLQVCYDLYKMSS